MAVKLARRQTRSVEVVAVEASVNLHVPVRSHPTCLKEADFRLRSQTATPILIRLHGGRGYLLLLLVYVLTSQDPVTVMARNPVAAVVVMLVPAEERSIPPPGGGVIAAPPVRQALPSPTADRFGHRTPVRYAPSLRTSLQTNLEVVVLQLLAL